MLHPMIDQAIAEPRPGMPNLSQVLDQIGERIAKPDAQDGVTLREILDAVGRRSYGPLLLIIGLFSISPATIVPGMTWFSAALTLIVAVQMALGMQRTWLPRKALDMAFSHENVAKGVAQFRPWAKRVDRVLVPRLEFLADPPFVNLVALFCVAAALVTIPLGFIPFAPLAPGLAIVFFGLGMTARDGLWLFAGAVACGVAAWLVLPLAAALFD
jgi:hypothetical protein